MLYLYNSLTRSREIFKPIKAGKISLYVCGNTVYDNCHMGHARSMVCFDVMLRFLKSIGYEVTYVRNITDIDDKIIARASERNVSITSLTETYIQAMDEDAKALGLLPPDSEPRATAYIPAIIALIKDLVDKGYAYPGEDGDVYFEVERFPTYGKLAHKDLAGLIAGARVEVAESKRSSLDFVLWKKAKAGEPAWSSPWGEGRPGWHIECSAMAMTELGEQFDIHGGGLDLQFPHHENEIAQSESATGKPFANYWLHVGMLQVNNEKMAKSVGNFFTIQEVLKTHHPEVVRYFLLSSHYRSPLNYSEDNLKNASKALTRLYQALKDSPITNDSVDLNSEWVSAFNQAMNDDFNTPIALSVLFDLSRAINKTHNADLSNTLHYLGGIIGLLQTPAQQFLQAGISSEETQHIDALIHERNASRIAKDWARADAIRDELLQMGVELEDKASGSGWRKI